MKLVYAVLNVAKTVLTEDGGLLFGKAGDGLLTEGATYSAQYFTDREAAERKADEYARGGTAAVLFVAYEARIIKPTPIKVITVSIDRS